jgi:hypothetical protein
MWGELLWIAIALVVLVAGAATLTRSSPRRRRQEWINEQLAAQEATAPGGKFSDDEYLLRLEQLEDQWDEQQGR